MSRTTTGAATPANGKAGAILAIDTATARAVVALGDAEGRLLAESTWQAGYRHGEELLARIDALLRSEGIALEWVRAIVVGTGPGAFTGLRVGLATAKALAHALDRPMAAVSTARALLESAASSGAAGPLALLLPAGPSDRVIVDAAGARLVPGGRDADVPPGTTLVAVDLDGRAPPEAIALGATATAGLASRLIALGARRLADGGDDLAAVVPEYVTLPRGVREEGGDVAWSHDLP